MFGMLGAGRPGDDLAGETQGGESVPGAMWVATESSAALPLAEVVEHSVAAAPDVNAVATRNGREVDVLLWNYHDADVAAPSVEVHVAIDGLRGRAAVAAEFRMDREHSNAYRAWQRMGSPAEPTAEQTLELERAGALEQTVADHPMALRAGKADLRLTLPRQAVVLLRLRERSLR
jgi:xylan 1,4-beta-xylosidase